MSATLAVQYIKQPETEEGHNTVGDKAKSLPEALREFQDRTGLSFRKMSEQIGGKIKAARLNKIANGKYGTITEPTIMALAELLGVDAEQVMAYQSGGDVHRGEVGTARARAFLRSFERLPDEDKEYFIPTIEILSDAVQKRLRGEPRVHILPGVKSTNRPGIDALKVRDELKPKFPELTHQTVILIVGGQTEGIDPKLVTAVERVIEDLYEDEETPSSNASA